jgi:hypothetical protein
MVTILARAQSHNLAIHHCPTTAVTAFVAAGRHAQNDIMP